MNYKCNIWGEVIPYNNTKSKLNDMDIKGHSRSSVQTLKFLLGIKGKKYRETKKEIDTFTYMSEIQPGYEKETYEDIPYIVPYIVEGSDQAIIIIPGGGYAHKSIDVNDVGKQEEGELAAKKLNDAGINAFVLWYRSNPYHMPAPLCDVQRAIRYIRYHADTFHIHPSKIGLLGFSAGGFQAGGFINLQRGEKIEVEYIDDSIDRISDDVALAGFLYPCFSYKYNVPMMFASFPAEMVRDDTLRNQLLDQYDCLLHMRSEHIPQFVCYGTKDLLVDSIQSKQYVNLLKTKNVPHKCLELHGASHGFGACACSNKKYAYWMEEFIDWAKQIFESL